jgi:hypothetical protein
MPSHLARSSHVRARRRHRRHGARSRGHHRRARRSPRRRERHRPASRPSARGANPARVLRPLVRPGRGRDERVRCGRRFAALPRAPPAFRAVRRPAEGCPRHAAGSAHASRAAGQAHPGIRPGWGSRGRRRRCRRRRDAGRIWIRAARSQDRGNRRSCSRPGATGGTAEAARGRKHASPGAGAGNGTGDGAGSTTFPRAGAGRGNPQPYAVPSRISAGSRTGKGTCAGLERPRIAVAR